MSSPAKVSRSFLDLSVEVNYLLPVLLLILSVLILFSASVKRFFNRCARSWSPRSEALTNAHKVDVVIMTTRGEISFARRNFVLLYPTVGKVYTRNMMKGAEKMRQQVKALWEVEKENVLSLYCGGKMPKEERQELVEILLWECQKNIEPYTTTGAISNWLCPEICSRVLLFLGSETTESGAGVREEPRVSGIEILVQTVLDPSFLDDFTSEESEQKKKPFQGQDKDDADFEHDLSFWYVPVISAIRSGGSSGGCGDSEETGFKEEIGQFLKVLKKLIFASFVFQFLLRYRANEMVKKKKTLTDSKFLSIYILFGALLIAAPYIYEKWYLPS